MRRTLFGVWTMILAGAVLGAETQTRALQRCGLGRMERAAYSPNSDTPRVVTAGAFGAAVWNAETGAPIRVLSAPGHYVRSVAISRDGTKIATGSGTEMRLWDASTGMEILGIDDGANAIGFSPDGKWVLAAFSSMARLYDAATGERSDTYFLQIPLGVSGILSVSFSPDGTKVLTGGDNNRAMLFDVSTAETLQSFIGHASRVTSVAFLPDGTKVLTGSWDDTAKLWNASSGAVIQTFTGHTDRVQCVAVSPDGTKALTGGDDFTVKLWNIATAAEIWTYSGHTSSVRSVGFSPDGSLAMTASYDQTCKLLDVSSGEEVRMLQGHTSVVSSAVLSPDGTQVLTGSGYWWEAQTGRDCAARLWDARSGKQIRTFDGHTDVVTSVAFSPDGTQALTGSYDTTGKLWDVATGTEIRTLSGHPYHVDAVAISPDGTKALTGSSTGPPDHDGIAKLWDLASGAEILSFERPMSGVTAVAFSSDGTKVLTGNHDGTATLWNASTAAEILTVEHEIGSVYSAALSSDGSKILTGTSGLSVGLWDASTGELVRTLEGPGIAKGVAFSPDGAKALTGWDSTVSPIAQLWDVTSGALIRTFSSHSMAVNSVAFSPDGSKALTGGEDGVTLVWELLPPRGIIIAGGGAYAGNAIAQQTDDLGAFAYKTLIRRGYEADDICYLTAFGPTDPENPSIPHRDADGDGLNDVDGWSTLDSLREAITGDFGQGAGRLMIVMIDHGNRTGEFMAFRMNETQSLLSTTLDGWLDDLQTPIGGGPAPDVTLVVDSCYSGQMVEDCRVIEEELGGE